MHVPRLLSLQKCLVLWGLHTIAYLCYFRKGHLEYPCTSCYVGQGGIGVATEISLGNYSEEGSMLAQLANMARLQPMIGFACFKVRMSLRDCGSRTMWSLILHMWYLGETDGCISWRSSCISYRASNNHLCDLARLKYMCVHGYFTFTRNTSVI